MTRSRTPDLLGEAALASSWPDRILALEGGTAERSRRGRIVYRRD
jgi:hypothetical protein